MTKSTINYLKRCKLFNVKSLDVIDILISTKEGLNILNDIQNYIFEEPMFFELKGDDDNSKQMDNVTVHFSDNTSSQLNIADINEFKLNNIIFFLKLLKTQKTPYKHEDIEVLPFSN